MSSAVRSTTARALLGRLLSETGSIPEDQLEAARFTRRPGSTIPLGEIDYSLVTDGLEAEREQGITIDVAYRHLMLPSRRRAILADAPGHEQYTRNMAVAASTADVGILLIDAMRGTKRQTPPPDGCGLMGVRHVVLAVNKLDGVGYDQGIYNELVAEVSTPPAAWRSSRSSRCRCPRWSATTSAHSPNTPWYHGPTLLDALDAAEILEDPRARSGCPCRRSSVAGTSAVTAVLSPPERCGPVRRSPSRSPDSRPPSSNCTGSTAPTDRARAGDPR